MSSKKRPPAAPPALDASATPMEYVVTSMPRVGAPIDLTPRAADDGGPGDNDGDAPQKGS